MVGGAGVVAGGGAAETGAGSVSTTGGAVGGAVSGVDGEEAVVASVHAPAEWVAGDLQACLEAEAAREGWVENVSAAWRDHIGSGVGSGTGSGAGSEAGSEASGRMYDDLEIGCGVTWHEVSRRHTRPRKKPCRNGPSRSHHSPPHHVATPDAPPMI